MDEKPSPEDVAKQKRGRKIEFHDESHAKQRAANYRHYWRTKYEKDSQRAHALKRRGPVRKENETNEQQNSGDNN